MLGATMNMDESVASAFWLSCHASHERRNLPAFAVNNDAECISQWPLSGNLIGHIALATNSLLGFSTWFYWCNSTASLLLHRGRALSWKENALPAITMTRYRCKCSWLFVVHDDALHIQ